MVEKITNKLREFKLSSIAVDNATSVFLLTFMILLFGVQSYQNMPKEQYPDASMPTITITAPHFGNSAEDIENLITRPIEKEVNSIVGLKKLRSNSMQDFSVITAEFQSDMDTELALRRVKDAVDKADLPSDLDQEPEVVDLDFSEIPIVTINISGQFPMDDLRKHAEYLQDKIENIGEVSEARMSGDQEREVKINMDLLKMQALKVSCTDVETAIARENVTMSGGEVNKNGNRRSVRVIGEFNNWDWETGIPMKIIASEFIGKTELPIDQTIQYRYLIDNRDWENDWDADAYFPTEYGVDNSVVDTHLEEAEQGLMHFVYN